MPATTKQRSIIEAAFRSLPEVYAGFHAISDILLVNALNAEKQHRTGRSVQGFPALLAARYFVVKWLAEYASGRAPLPELREVHRLRPECVLAASYAADFPEFKAWADGVPAEFWELDYAEMMA